LLGIIWFSKFVLVSCFNELISFLHHSTLLQPYLGWLKTEVILIADFLPRKGVCAGGMSACTGGEGGVGGAREWTGEGAHTR